MRRTSSNSRAREGTPARTNRGDLEWCVSKMFPEVKSCEFQKTWNENSKWFDVGDRQGRLWKYDPMTALVFI